MPSGFEIGYAGIESKDSIVEYVPKGESVHNWSEIITLTESGLIDKTVRVGNPPRTYSAFLGQIFYKRYFKKDKDLNINYIASYNKKEYNSLDKDFKEISMKSNNILVYIDYPSRRIKKGAKEREFLVARGVESDINMWGIQYTIRYDGNLSKEEISLKQLEAIDFIKSIKYEKSDPLDNIKKSIKKSGDKNIKMKSQRLDDRDLNEKFKEIAKMGSMTGQSK